MNKKDREEDLGIKIGSKEEANWTSIKKQSEELLVEGYANIKINEAIVRLAEKQIEEEKEKFK